MQSEQIFSLLFMLNCSVATKPNCKLKSPTYQSIIDSYRSIIDNCPFFIYCLYNTTCFCFILMVNLSRFRENRYPTDFEMYSILTKEHLNMNFQRRKWFPLIKSQHSTKTVQFEYENINTYSSKHKR